MRTSRLESNWGWAFARGIAGIVFGVLALAWPGQTLFSLMLGFAVFAFFEGMANIISAVSGGRPGEPAWGTLMVEGLLSIIFAGLIVMSPARMAAAAGWALGFWAVLTGALRIGAALRLRKIIDREWMLALDGACSIAFGLLLVSRPVESVRALVWWLGIYSITFGLLTAAVGVRLRSHLVRTRPRQGAPVGPVAQSSS